MILSIYRIFVKFGDCHLFLLRAGVSVKDSCLHHSGRYNHTYVRRMTR